MPYIEDDWASTDFMDDMSGLESFYYHLEIVNPFKLPTGVYDFVTEPSVETFYRAAYLPTFTVGGGYAAALAVGEYRMIPFTGPIQMYRFLAAHKIQQAAQAAQRGYQSAGPYVRGVVARGLVLGAVYLALQEGIGWLHEFRGGSILPSFHVDLYQR